MSRGDGLGTVWVGRAAASPDLFPGKDSRGGDRRFLIDAKVYIAE